MSLSGLRRSASRMGGGQRKGRGGSKIFSKLTLPNIDKIQGQLTPQEVPMVPEPIVLVPGEYPDVFDDPDPLTGQPPVREGYHHKSHRFVLTLQGGRKSFRAITCTCGPDNHNPQPCYGCLKIDRREWDDKQNAARTTWCFNAAHLVPYHHMPLMRDGQIQYKQNSNEPVMITRECNFSTVSNRLYWGPKGRNKQCEGCQQNANIILGGHRYLELGKNHLLNFLDFNRDVLEKICSNCNTNCIKTGFSCGRCKNMLVDIASSGMTNDEIAQYEKNPVQCAHCQQVSLPVATFECGYTPDGLSYIGNCCPEGVETVPLNIFDVVMWVQRQGENTDSKISIVNWCKLTEAPFGPDGQAMDISAYIREQLVPQTFDFEKMFAQTPEEQAKEVGDNPQQSQQQAWQAPQGAGAPPTVPGAMPGPAQQPQHPQMTPQAPQPPGAPPQQPYGAPPQAPQPPAPPAQPPQQPPGQPQQPPGIATPYPQQQSPGQPPQAPMPQQGQPQPPPPPGNPPGRPPWGNQ